MMKNRLSKPAFYLLVVGLLLSTTVPLLTRHYHWPDALTGFMTGLGLAMEVAALVSGRNKCSGAFWKRWRQV